MKIMQKITLTKNLGVLLFTLITALLIAFPSLGQAGHVADTAVLTVDQASVVNGQPVLLQWFLDGHVSSCTISDNNGVIIDIGSPTLPHTNSQSVTPPANTSTTYTLSCNGASGSVSVAVKPTINFTSDQGTTLTYDPYVGRVTPLTLRWNANFATGCSDVWFETNSNPGVRNYLIHGNVNRNTANGRVNVDNGNNPPIVEDGTFYIDCNNTTVGTTNQASIPYTVIDPPPPGALNVGLWSSNPGTHPNYTASRDPLIGWSRATVLFNSSNAQTCSYSLRKMSDGSAMSLPPGSVTGNVPSNSRTSGTFYVQFGEDMFVDVTCDRPDVTIGGVFYPGDTFTRTIDFTILADGLGDRSSVAPVTVTLTADITNPVLNPLTGKARVILSFSPRNAEYCDTRAERISDGSAIGVQGWGGRFNGNSDFSRAVFPSEDTRFIMECERPYDLLYGTPAVQALAYATDDEFVYPVAPTQGVQSLSTHMFAVPHRMTPSMMYSTAISNSGTQPYVVDSVFLQGPPNVSGPYTTDIVFPFDHPTDGTDTYDVITVYCDEADGINTFTLTFPNTGETDTWTSDSPFSLGNDYCNQAEERVHVMSNITLSEGDPINIHCVNNEPGQLERCRIRSMFFVRPGSDGMGYTTPAIDPMVGYESVSLLWYADNATRCYNQNAQPVYASSYSYSPDTDIVHFEEQEDLATTTEYFITCDRPSIDSQVQTSSVIITVPGSGPVTSVGGVDAGDCRDQAGGGGTGPHDLLGPNTTGGDTDVRSAELGERADPGTTLCIASIDLAADTPAQSGSPLADNNGVSGLWNGLTMALGLLNLGDGEVFANTNLAYKAELDVTNPALQGLFGVTNVNSAVNYFNGTIATPATNHDIPSARLTSQTVTAGLNGVPFGTHQWCARFNLDGSPNYPENEDWLGLNPYQYLNNQNCANIYLPVPQPPMSLTADRTLIRKNDTITLTYSAHTDYPMSCTIQGPGGVNINFNANDNAPSATGGTITTAPLTSTSRFVLTCTEAITGESFTIEEIVEVTPDFEET